MSIDNYPTPHRRGILILALDFVVFLLLLKFLPFSASENRGLALLVFVGILWLTEAFNITITALMVPIFAVLLGVSNTQQAFAPFSNPIIFMFLGGFVIAAVLTIQKIDLWIAQHIIRLAKGRLKTTIIYLFGVTAALSMFINNVAVTAMMLPLAIGILSKIDVAKNRKLYVFVLLGIAYSASIGGIGTLVGSTPNALLASLTNISFVDFLPYGMPVLLLLMPLTIFIMAVILRPNFNVEFAVEMEKIPMTRPRKITLAIFALFAFMLIFSKLVEPVISGFMGVAPIKNFDSLTALFIIVLICVSGVANWKQIQQEAEWGILLLFGGGLVLSNLLQTTGASKILADGIMFIAEGKPLLFVTLILATFIVFLTEFTSNTASAALLMPIFISVATSLNLSAIGLAEIIAAGASCAFMLPIATPPNAMVFATGHIRQSEMAKIGFYMNVGSVLIIGGLAYFFWV